MAMRRGMDDGRRVVPDPGALGKGEMMKDKITQEHKKWIDDASYRMLLKRNRFAKIGDPIFIGKTGEYYFAVMRKKYSALPRWEHVKISKSIGWKEK